MANIGEIRIQPAPNGGCRIERYGFPGLSSTPLWFKPQWSRMEMPAMDATFDSYEAALQALYLSWPFETPPLGFEKDFLAKPGRFIMKDGQMGMVHP